MTGNRTSVEHIPGLSATGLMRRFITDPEFATKLYGVHPSDEAAFDQLAAKIASRDYPCVELADILREQNRVWGMSAETEAGITALETGAYCVITGQQAGLFSGPLYTVYKALTAVALARELSTRLEKPVVPVFWIASDDHDLPEIDHAVIPGPDGTPVTVRYAHSSTPGARVSRQVFGDDIAEVLNRVESLLPIDAPHRDWLVDGLHAAYVPGRSWTDAFGMLLSSWLGHTGVVMVSPDDERLKRLMAGVFTDEISDPEVSISAIEGREQTVTAEGYSPQVVRTETGTLLFLDDESGARKRIDLHPDGYALGDRVVSRDELGRIFAERPGEFSANALLRPVTGDVVFPTLAHVMGPGETAYMAQSRGLYERHDVPMPVVVPRARFSVVPRDVSELVESLEISLESAFQPVERLVSLRAEATQSGDVVNDARRDISAAWDRLARQIAEVYPGMNASVMSAHAKTHGLLNHVERKIHQHARRDVRRAEGADIERIAGVLYPQGSPQERVLAPLRFLVEHGPTWIDEILDAIDPFDFDHVVVEG
jgi:bacillithiol synthase